MQPLGRMLGRRDGEHIAAVAGSEIEGDARVARREIGDLADVDFVETAACDHAEHASKAN